MEQIPKIDSGFADYYIKKMTMYSENTKSYIQIAMASLVVPITFYKQLLGQNDGERFIPDNWLIASWGMLLLTIGSGLLYQYFAIKRIESRIEHVKARYLDKNPGLVYFIMLLTFYLGTILFVISAILRLDVPETPQISPKDF